MPSIIVTGSRGFSTTSWSDLLSRLFGLPWETLYSYHWANEFVQPTPQTPAEAFANRAIELGVGFDPNNPVHQQWLAKTKQALIALYNAAHDGIEGGIRSSDGQFVTDSELRTYLS